MRRHVIIQCVDNKGLLKTYSSCNLSQVYIRLYQLVKSSAVSFLRQQLSLNSSVYLEQMI